MENRRKQRVFYVCFYAEADIADRIISYPSVWSKIDYVIATIKRTGREVVLLSIAESKKGKFIGFIKKIDDQEKHIYLSSRKYMSKIGARLGNLFQWIKIISFLLYNVKKNDKVVVYHSLYNRIWLRVYRKIFGKHFIIEIEDVFSELTKDTARFRTAEWNLFRMADACLCVNDIIKEKIDTVQLVVSYGNYLVPEELGERTHRGVRLVYAGVIEQNRKAAFLAVDAMRFLPDDYELHVLGFGEEKDIQEIERLIWAINEKSKVDRVFYHGRMSGNEYYAFLQSCDIGLSTHVYDEESMNAADHTFPSKVLVYLGNGLRVVAQRLECLEKSAVAKALSFYDNPTPESVADAILNTDLTGRCDSRRLIHELDDKFTREIGELLNN